MNNYRLILALTALAFAGPVAAHNGVIHEAPHGGIMKPLASAHVEIVLAPKGGVRIYVYDTKSAALPASAASDMSVEIDRPGQKTEYVKMHPDPTGTLWTGDSKPVTDPASIVRIGTVISGASGLVEVPRSKFPIYGKASPKEAHAH
ncbi:hypothetical protein BH10PSE13_BH10PSE13_01500 [soil metagenome]